MPLTCENPDPRPQTDCSSEAHTCTMLPLFSLPFCPGTRSSCGFFTHLTDVIKEGLGRYFSGRPDLKVIAEPGGSLSAFVSILSCPQWKYTVCALIRVL